MVIVDGAKRIVELKSRPKRVVSLSPGTTELLYAIGAGPQVVGVTSWCDFPPEVHDLAKVGDMNVNFEAIAALAPDLIVADATLQQASISRLESLGLPVFVISAREISGILDSVELLGRATGNIGGAQDLIRELVQILTDLRHQVDESPLAKDPVSVLVLFDPTELYSAGKGTYIHEAITRAGGVNIGAQAPGSWPLLSEEYVLSQNPEVIFLTYGDPGQILKRPGWSRLRAVQNNQVHLIEANIYSRPTDRLIRGIAPLYGIFRDLREEG